MRCALEFGVFHVRPIFRPWDRAWIDWGLEWIPGNGLVGALLQIGRQAIDGIGSTMVIDVWFAMGRCELACIDALLRFTHILRGLIKSYQILSYHIKF